MVFFEVAYWIHALYTNGSGIATGQTLQVVVRKVIRSPKNDFGERSTLFSTQFYQKSIWAMLTRSKCKFLFE